MSQEHAVDYALTTKERIKELLGLTVSDLDVVFDRLISSSTDFIEGFCNRRFKHTTYTHEVYSLTGRGRELFLKQQPVTALTALEYRAGLPSNPNWTAFLADQYELLEDGASGIVALYGASLGFSSSGNNAVRATYSAGYLIDFDNVNDPTKHNLPHSLSHLCENIVIRYWKGREASGKAVESVNGASINWRDDFTKDEQSILNDFVRLPAFM